MQYLLSVLLIFVLLGFTPLEKKSISDDEPKVGLVLSGGGAAGIAHIGILKVLDEIDFPVDIITGTSAGGLIGALYAIGYTASDIEEIFVTADWRKLFSDEISRDFLPLEEKLLEPNYLITLPADNLNIHLPMGAIVGHQITKLLTRLTWHVHDVDDFSQLPRPFEAIATDLETGEMVVLNSGFLPVALRASMSIPSAFAPIELDGKLLVDGGLKRNLPVQNAIDLGADFIISVDASSDLKPVESLKGFNDVLAQTIAIGILPNMEEQQKLSNFHLAPDLQDFDISSFNEVKKLIEVGEAEARKYIDTLKSLADSLKNLKPSYSHPEALDLKDDSFYLTDILVDGIDGIFKDVILSAMELKEGRVSLSEIERGINNLQGMRFFEKAYYRVDTPGDTSSVTLFVSEHSGNTFNIGFRYDNYTKTSLILNLRTSGVFLPFSTWRFTGVLGDELKLQAQFLTYTNTRPKFALYSQTSYRLQKFDLVEAESIMATAESNIFSTEFMLGPLYSEGAMFAAGYQWQLFNQNLIVGDVPINKDWRQTHQLFAQIFRDSFNHDSFPTNGFRLLVRTSWPVPFLDYSYQYSHHFIELENYIPVNSTISAFGGLYGGQAFGSDIPLHQLFYLGEFHRFAGLRRQGSRGDGVASIHTGVQYNFYSSFFLSGRFNVGNTFDEIYNQANFSDLVWGWGLSLGWDSVIGPVNASLSGTTDWGVRAELTAGFRF